jgi:hypothetical protein
MPQGSCSRLGPDEIVSRFGAGVALWAAWLINLTIVGLTQGGVWRSCARCVRGGTKVKQGSRVVALVFGLAISGCAGLVRPPEVKTLYTASEPMVARGDSASVEVFLPVAPPERAYVVLGQVEVSTQRRHRRMDELLQYAKVGARRMGGDALINLEADAIPTPARVGSAYPVYGNDGRVVGVNSFAGAPGLRRTLRAVVVRWK